MAPACWPGPTAPSAGSTASSAATSTATNAIRGWSTRQQLLHGVVDEFRVVRAEYGVAGAMAPDRRDRPQLGVFHAGDLAAVVLDREVKIGFARHHDCLGVDRAERLG